MQTGLPKKPCDSCQQIVPNIYNAGYMSAAIPRHSRDWLHSLGFRASPFYERHREPRRPHQFHIILLAVHAVPQPYTPRKIDVPRVSGHKVPAVPPLVSPRTKDRSNISSAQLTTTHGPPEKCPKATQPPPASAAASGRKSCRDSTAETRARRRPDRN